MKAISISALLLLIVIESAIVASGYKITKVIEVGPGRGSLVGTVKWSPDGTKLAYFHESTLYLSDTTGASREIAGHFPSPHRYEWLSDNELVISLWWFLSSRVDTFCLKLVDISTGQISQLEAYRRGSDLSSGGIPHSFQGPYLSLEGNVYYRTNVVRRRGSGPEGIRFVESAYPDTDSKLSPSENHFLEWGTDCLYMINGDLSDTVRIAPKPYSHVPFPPVVNPDLTYYIVGGTICRMEDSTYIVLDTMVREHPPGTVECDFLYYSFNPTETEVLFDLNCDDGESYIVHRMGTFDCITNEFTIIDSTIGIEDCEAPVYAPDGKKIAFLSRGKVYILYRGKSDAVQQK